MTPLYCKTYPPRCDPDQCYVRPLPVCVRVGQKRCKGGSSVVMEKVPLSTAPSLRNSDRIKKPLLLEKSSCPQDTTETFCYSTDWESPPFDGYNVAYIYLTISILCNNYFLTTLRRPA